MKSEIKLNNKIVLKCYIEKQRIKCLLEDGTIMLAKDAICSVVCCDCKRENIQKSYRKVLYFSDNEYRCQSCNKLGIRNPFYGKKHSDTFKAEYSKKRKLWKTSNQFIKAAETGIPYVITDEYRKNMSISVNKAYENLELRKKCITKAFLGHHHTEKTKDIYRQNILKRLQDGKTYRISKPQRLVQEYLKSKNISNTINKIVDKYSFDFYIHNTNILIEVQGDYWHANPKIYTDKSKLTERQKIKIKIDSAKLQCAMNNSYRVIYIWEQDIKNDNYEALNEIQIG